MTAMAFEDRRGNVHYPKHDSVVRSREGVFSCCVCNEKVLLIWPDIAPDVPELPGGGIEPDENIHEANNREFYEETGFFLPSLDATLVDSFEQSVRYYADADLEFWIYKQTIFLYRDDLSSVYFDGERRTPENGKMRWVSLAEINELPIRYMHREALQKFGILKT